MRLTLGVSGFDVSVQGQTLMNKNGSGEIDKEICRTNAMWPLGAAARRSPAPSPSGGPIKGGAVIVIGSLVCDVKHGYL